MKKLTKKQQEEQNKYIDPPIPSMYSDIYSMRLKGIWLGMSGQYYVKLGSYKSMRPELKVDSTSDIRWGLGLYESMTRERRNIVSYGLSFLPMVTGLMVMAPTTYSDEMHSFLSNHPSQGFEFKGVAEDFSQKAYCFSVNEHKLLEWVMTGDTLNQPVLNQKGARVVNNK